MPVSVPPTGRIHGDTVFEAWIGRSADDVPPGWMDHAIRRMLHVANCHLLRFEQIKEEDLKKKTLEEEFDNLERMVLVLWRLARNFRFLIEFETSRAGLRATIRPPNNEGARERLIRHVTKVLGPEYALEIPERPGD